MDIMELLEYLDIEEPEEFEFFEHLADLLELENEISYEACFSLFSAVPESTLTELIANYFEEVMENLPDDTVDIFTLLTTIRQCLLGLSRNIGEPEGVRTFVDEFIKFRNWYSMDSRVHCKRISDGQFSDVTVGEALALCRLEKLNEDAYNYDFSDCLDYEIDEYSMSLSDIVERVDFDDEDEDLNDSDHEDCDHDHRVTHAHDGLDVLGAGLVDLENPVIDGEFEDEEYCDEE